MTVRSSRIFVFVCLAVISGLCQLSCSRTEKGIRTELIRVQTADGVWLDGVLREPQSKHSKAGIVMVHGYGGNFYSGIMSFLPKGLSENGCTTFALNMRDHDRGPKKNLFEENLQDIAAGVDEMARRGYKELFLFGHSMGTNRVLFYQAESQDARIAGLILTGAPGNLFQWNVKMFGLEAATQVLRRAQKLKEEGNGDAWMLIDLGPLGKTLYTANHVVSLRGPQTVSDPFMNVARFTKPILIVHGLADHLADPKVADSLKNNARPASRVTVVKVPAADHRFHEHQKELVEIIYQWLFQQLQY